MVIVTELIFKICEKLTYIKVVMITSYSVWFVLMEMPGIRGSFDKESDSLLVNLIQRKAALSGPTKRDKVWTVRR